MGPGQNLPARQAAELRAKGFSLRDMLIAGVMSPYRPTRL
jgi:hypothetical protein